MSPGDDRGPRAEGGEPRRAKARVVIGDEETPSAIDDYFTQIEWPFSLVWESHGELICMVFVVVVGGEHYIDPVATAPAETGRGRGHELARAVLAALSEAGIAEVGATITDGNVPSQRLFASLGFERLGPWPRRAPHESLH